MHYTISRRDYVYAVYDCMICVSRRDYMMTQYMPVIVCISSRFVCDSCSILLHISSRYYDDTAYDCGCQVYLVEIYETV